MLPKRKYVHGKKRSVTFRIPHILYSEIQKIAKRLGMTTTSIVVTVLDQTVQENKTKHLT